MHIRDPMYTMSKGIHRGARKSFGTTMKEHGKEVEQQEGRRYTGNAKQSAKLSNTNQQSQTIPHVKIMSSTAAKLERLLNAG